MNIQKIGRINLKYQKYKYKHNKIYSLILIFLYILRNIINIILLKINLIFSIKNLNGKRILFIEPPRQGYGDLLFQTPIFSILNKNEYKIDVLIKNNHGVILENNPYISGILFWNLKNIFKIIFTKYDFIIGLGRDTIKTNLILFLKPFLIKIIPDSNLNLWHKIFDELNPSQSWQKLILSEFNLIFNFEIPQIYFSKNELEKIKDIKNSYRHPLILIISEVDDKLKQYPYWDYIFKKFKDNLLITLTKNKDTAINFLKKDVLYIFTKSYREAIYYVAASDIIIGVEGSLMHIASVFDKNLIVLEANNLFEKQTFLEKPNKFIIINNHICEYWYRTDLKKYLKICYLNKNKNIKSRYNLCLANILPEIIIEKIKFMIKNNF